ncbi:MAG: YqjD family protein [Sulfurimicrobium sp.]
MIMYTEIDDAVATELVSREKLVSDLKVVIGDAEELLRATANQAGEKIAEIRVKAEENLRNAKIRLARAEEAMLARTKAAARATDDYVRANPWRAVGIAAGAGFIVGLLVGRR